MPKATARRAAIPVLLAAMLSIASPADADSEPLTVMTYNVYLGGDAGAVLSAPRQEVPSRVSALYRELGASAVPGRLAAIAGSIAGRQPHLVALQEMTLIRRQTPGDMLTGQVAPNAEAVALDFQAVLMAAMEAAGMDYEIAATVQNTDVEMPMPVEGGSFDDVRMTTFDAILVRRDVEVSRVEAANYEAMLTSPLGFSVRRGYVALDARVSGRTWRFVNTHLEAYSNEVRQAQARELLAALEGETFPLIVSGDFNSDAGAPRGDPSRAVYDLLTSQGYEDAWRDGAGTGATCCQASGLRNAESGLSVRIDHIFTRNVDGSSVIAAGTVGDRPSERLASGLWPSDHAGVIVSLASP